MSPSEDDYSSPRTGNRNALLAADRTFIRVDIAPLADADSARKQVNFW